MKNEMNQDNIKLIGGSINRENEIRFDWYADNAERNEKRGKGEKEEGVNELALFFIHFCKVHERKVTK